MRWIDRIVQVWKNRIMIDADGFRHNVGIVLSSGEGRVLWARRVASNIWQFPQGGIHEHETPEQAMFRELREEVGLTPDHVVILASTPHWLRYRLPARMIRHHQQPVCIGQKQRWFLLRMKGADQDVCLTVSDTPEFDRWRWVNYWHPLKEVAPFKRRVYARALGLFAPLADRPALRISPLSCTSSIKITALAR